MISPSDIIPQTLRELGRLWWGDTIMVKGRIKPDLHKPTTPGELSVWGNHMCSRYQPAKINILELHTCTCTCQRSQCWSRANILSFQNEPGALACSFFNKYRVISCLSLPRPWKHLLTQKKHQRYTNVGNRVMCPFGMLLAAAASSGKASRLKLLLGTVYYIFCTHHSGSARSGPWWWKLTGMTDNR